MSLQVWLPLNGDLTQQGTGSTTFSGTPAWKTYGKIGNAALNLQNRITCTTTTLNGVQFFSVTFWARIENNPDSTANWMDVIGFTDQTSSGTNGQFRFETGYGNNIYSGIHWHDNATNAIIGGSYTYNTGTEFDKWHHIAVTISDTEVCSYYDGILKSTITTNLNKGHLTGAWWLGESTTRGCIQDVRIYDHALSAAEVREISQGLVLHYKLDGGLFGNSNLLLNTHFDNRYNQTTGWDTTKNGTLLANDWGGYNSGVANQATCYHAHLTLFNNEYVYEYTKESESWLGINQSGLQNKLVAGKKYTFSCEQYSVTNTNYMYGGLYYYKTGASSAGFHLGYIYCNTNRQPNTWQKFTYTFTAPSDGDYTKAMRWYCYGHSGGAGTFYLRHLKLEEGEAATQWCLADSEGNINHNIIEDSSGYNHNGTITGNITLNTNTPRYSTAPSFNGTERITTTTLGADIRTLSCWCKTTKNKSTSQHMVADSFSNMCISFYQGTIIGVFGTTRSTGSKCTLGDSYKENDWNHIVVVKTDNAGARDIYCNGVKLTPASNDYWSAAAGFFVGARNTSNGNPFYGQISDVRAYVTALDTDAIRQLYEVGAKVDKEQNLHAFELNESNSGRELLAVPLTPAYNDHTSVYSGYDANGEITLTGKKSIGSGYLKINPTGHTYYYDIEMSSDANNVFYIGFERYDANKTARSNQACVYLSGLGGEKTARSHAHYHGTIDLSTDGVNPTDTIALRILNDWSSQSNRNGTVHRISLREVPSLQNSKINKKGQVITDELIELDGNCRIQKNGTIEANEFIEL